MNAWMRKVCLVCLLAPLALAWPAAAADYRVLGGDFQKYMDDSWAGTTIEYHAYDSTRGDMSAYCPIAFPGMPPEVRIYAPFALKAQAHLVAEAVKFAWPKYLDMFNLLGGDLNGRKIRFFLVKDIRDGKGRKIKGLTYSRNRFNCDGDVNVMLSAGTANYAHTTIHELMHVFQLVSKVHPSCGGDYDPDKHNWMVEGHAWPAPLLLGAPPQFIDKQALYANPQGNANFEQTLQYFHDKALTARRRNAALFWYYYLKVVQGNRLRALGDAFYQYKASGYQNKPLPWLNVKNFWHDLALAAVNQPGGVTDILQGIDPDFALVKRGALYCIDNSVSCITDGAGVAIQILPYKVHPAQPSHVRELPFGGGADTIRLKPISAQYFEVLYLNQVNGALVLRLPDKKIPPDVKISVLLRNSQSGKFQEVKINSSTLSPQWHLRFPVNGQAERKWDHHVAYNRFVVVISNASDKDEHKLNLIISKGLHKKYQGRGVKSQGGVVYPFFLRKDLGLSRIKKELGRAFTLEVRGKQIKTRARSMLIGRSPLVPHGSKNLDKKAVRHIQDHAVFRGEVKFELLSRLPEKITLSNNRKVETGKIKLKRVEVQDLYDTPNRFKLAINVKDLLILGASPALAAAISQQWLAAKGITSAKDLMAAARANAATMAVGAAGMAGSAGAAAGGAMGGSAMNPAPTLKLIQGIIDATKEKYGKDTFGHAQKQIFESTLALGTTATGQEQEVVYEMGEDDNGPYLKFVLGNRRKHKFITRP